MVQSRSDWPGSEQDLRVIEGKRLKLRLTITPKAPTIDEAPWSLHNASDGNERMMRLGLDA
jgi:hypothetical protein